MRQQSIIVLFICMCLLVGCNNDGVENSSMEPSQEGKQETSDMRSKEQEE